MISRNRGLEFPGSSIVRFRKKFLEEMLASPHLVSIAWRQIETIRFLEEQIKGIESEVEAKMALKEAYRKLLTIPGIGRILAMTIMTEVGDITRFEKVGHYSSYCRCVNARSTSNGKKKGDNNRKNGNRYLAWAYVEAANFNKRSCPKAREFVQRKMAKTNYALAIKALGNKLTKASYFIMRDQQSYDPKLLFG
jgi:transposase